METSDEILCQRVAERDEAAFDLLVARYQERAYRIAWSILRNAEDARDLAQDAFLRLYEAAGSFGGRARFSTWFYRILVNLCLDHRRKARGWKFWAPARPKPMPSTPATVPTVTAVIRVRITVSFAFGVGLLTRETAGRIGSFTGRRRKARISG